MLILQICFAMEISRTLGEEIGFVATPPKRLRSFANPVSSGANTFASKEQLTRSSSAEMKFCPR